MVGVEQWAEIRRLCSVERRSSGRSAGGRGCIATRSAGVGGRRSRRGIRGRRRGRSSIRSGTGSASSCRSIRRIQSQRLRELAGELGYAGGKSIFDDYVREVRPRFRGRRTFQRTMYRPGELVQCDLWEPRRADPGRVMGSGAVAGWSPRRCAGRARSRATLVFSKEAPDILWGLARNLQRLGALPEKLVWDRESAIAAGGRPTEAFAAFCGQLAVGWVILEARDPQAKGALERSHRFMRTNFEPGRVFANHLDFQDRLDAWTEKANRRVHRTIRAVPTSGWPRNASRCGRCRLRCPTPTAARSSASRPSRSCGWIATTTRIDPAFAGRRVEVRVSQEHVTAVVLDTGELAVPAPPGVRGRPDDHRPRASDHARAPARPASAAS